jgi:hypothetical protein
MIPNDCRRPYVLDAPDDKVIVEPAGEAEYHHVRN